MLLFIIACEKRVDKSELGTIQKFNHSHFCTGEPTKNGFYYVYKEEEIYDEIGVKERYQHYTIGPDAPTCGTAINPIALICSMT